MLKAPRPGFVKTRLTPSLTKEEAAVFYTCLIKDTFLNIGLSGQSIDVIACVAKHEANAELSDIIPEKVAVTCQKDGDLGQKMYAAFVDAFASGCRRVVMIGSDSPDMPKEYIAEAFLLLKAYKESLILGPSEDGGYYLIGLGTAKEAIFKGVDWGTSAVLSETLEIAKREGIDAKLLPKWYDVDSFEDIGRLLKTGRAVNSIKYIKDNKLSWRTK